MEVNGYQRRKAKALAGVLILAAAASDTPMSQLPALAARMSFDQWRCIAFQAGQSVPDHAAKVYTIGLLLDVYDV